MKLRKKYALSRKVLTTRREDDALNVKKGVILLFPPGSSGPLSPLRGTKAVTHSDTSDHGTGWENRKPGKPSGVRLGPRGSTATPRPN